MPAPQFLRDAPLEPWLSLRLAVRAQALVHLRDDAELPEILARAKAAGWPVHVLGGGSNLAPAGDVPGLVLRVATRGMRQEHDGDHCRLRVAAGEHWHGLVRWSIAQGLGGLENLALIPGTVGAAPVQNIGAYGVELAPLVSAVQVVHLADGRRETLSAAQCAFGYRDSLFKGALDGKVLITALDLRLPRVATGAWQPCLDYAGVARELEALGHRPERARPVQVAEAVVRIRRRRLPDPRRVPNAGSFFKNPLLDAQHWQRLRSSHPGLPGWPQADGSVKVPAAWLIEAAGLRGWRHPDGAAVSARHALVLTVPAGAPADALHALADAVRARVQAQFGVRLEQEPRALSAA